MTPWSWLLILLLATAVPWLSVRSARAAVEAGIGRTALYLNATASLWVLAAVGYLVVRLDGGSLADVYVRWDLPAASGARLLGWTAGLTAAGLAVFAGGHLARLRFRLPSEDELLSRLRPRRRSEALWLALALCPSAGICEEFLYRGFLLARLADLLGSGTAAAAMAALAFGGAHLYQGALGASRAALIALALALPPLAAGTLLPSMAAHALIDAVGILWIWPLLEKACPLPARE